ncbi:FecR/PupR family sigma factor regulator [Chitiniphilus eburneus]|uniref:DUF4880 domain-containing protein n=1 Tax=Chitiniphilus eburneus TaxID=2571148 RepID=A0A4U0PWJ6_9NEIS|nr:DUF4880 domain-containing protein [Chitiniphilus eburneus]TJZ72941.1 DUF4880 domain-containing protein [Chitiniphilus eburneus]
MREDPIWEEAWNWVIRQHEGDFDTAAQAEFAAWMQAGADRPVAYEDAARIWLLTGLVPPANDVETEGCSRQEQDGA